MKTLRRLRELSHPESLALFGWSLLTVFLVAIFVRTRSLPALLHRLTRPSHARSTRSAQSQSDLRRMHTIWRYSHTIITSLLRSRRPCLLRSLVVYRYGCKHGMPTSIHFGARPGMDGLEGHSWVTLYGSPLRESEEGLRSYATVYSYPEDDTREIGLHQAMTMVGEQL